MTSPQVPLAKTHPPSRFSVFLILLIIFLAQLVTIFRNHCRYGLTIITPSELGCWILGNLTIPSCAGPTGPIKNAVDGGHRDGGPRHRSGRRKFVYLTTLYIYLFYFNLIYLTLPIFEPFHLGLHHLFNLCIKTNK